MSEEEPDSSLTDVSPTDSSPSDAVAEILSSLSSPLFKIQNFFFDMSLGGFNMGGPDPNGFVGLVANFTVVIGGDGGFEVDMGGAIDVAQGEAFMSVMHAGGWSPFAGALANIFQTPRFHGRATMTSDVFLSVECHASYLESIHVIPDMLSLKAHPHSPNASGVELDVALSLDSFEVDVDVETGEVDVGVNNAAYVVELRGGLQLGSGSSAPPILGVMGRVSKDAPSILILQTDEEWTPLPRLTLPALRGTMLVHTDSSIAVTIEATLDEWEMLPGVLSASNLQVNVSVSPFHFSDFNFSALSASDLPGVNVSISGDVLIGGDNPFPASFRGTIDTAASSAVLAITHPGGWVPLPGPLEAYLTTPRFDGELKLGVDGQCAQLRADVAWLDDIEFFRDVITLSSHPTATTSNSSGGPTMRIEVVAPDCNVSALADALGGVSTRLSFAAGLELGSPHARIPKIGALGDFLVPVSLGCSSLALETDSEWVPLPSRLPLLRIPIIYGNMTICNAANVTAFISSQPVDLAVVEDYLELFSARVSVAVGEFEPANPDGTLPALDVRASGSVQVGGKLGFAATVAGALNTEDQTVSLAVSHPGGWSPLSDLASLFETPAFNCSAAIGVGGVFLETHCTVAYRKPIKFIPGMLEILTPSAEIDLIKANQSGGDVDFAVGFAGGLRMGGDGFPGELPIIHVSGRLVSDGLSFLTLATAEEWVPLPDILSALRVPALLGHLTHDGGNVTANITALAEVGTALAELGAALAEDVVEDVAEDVAETGMQAVSRRQLSYAPSYPPAIKKLDVVDGVLELRDIWIVAEVPTFNIRQPSPADLNVGEMESVAAGGNASAAAGQLSLADIDLKVSMGAVARLGGSGGFEATVTGSFATRLGTAVLTLSHIGGWSPLAALSSIFFTPAFDCIAKFGVDGIRLAVKCDIAYPMALRLPPPGLLSGDAAAVAQMTVDNAAAEVSVVQRTNISKADWRVDFSGVVQIGGDGFPGALPRIQANGSFVSDGLSFVAMSTETEWVPLPAHLSQLVVPRLFGNLTLQGTIVTAYVTHEPIPRIVIIDDVFELTDVRVAAEQLPFDANTSEVPSFEISAWSGARIGGDDGFACTVFGSVNTQLGSAVITLSHAGCQPAPGECWSPLPDALARFVPQMPAFTCTAKLNVDGISLVVTCEVRWLQPIELLDGAIKMKGKPPERISAGPTIDIALSRQSNELGAIYDYSVFFEAAWTFHFGVGSLPMLIVSGRFRSRGPSTLDFRLDNANADGGGWQPLPSLMPSFRIPSLLGRATLYPSGNVTLWGTHVQPLSFSLTTDRLPGGGGGPGELLAFSNLRAEATVELHTTDRSRYAMRVNASSDVRLGGSLPGAIEFSVVAAFDVTGQAFELELIHDPAVHEPWCPFSGLGVKVNGRELCAPQLNGFVRMGDDPPASLPGRPSYTEAFFFAEATVTLPSSVTLIEQPIGLSVSAPGGAAGGPILGINFKQVARDASSPLEVEAFVSGELCFEFGGTICVDVRAAAAGEGLSFTRFSIRGSYTSNGCLSGCSVDPLALVMPQGYGAGLAVVRATTADPITVTLIVELQRSSEARRVLATEDGGGQPAARRALATEDGGGQPAARRALSNAEGEGGITIICQGGTQFQLSAVVQIALPSLLASLAGESELVEHVNIVGCLSIGVPEAIFEVPVALFDNLLSGVAIPGLGSSSVTLFGVTLPPDISGLRVYISTFAEGTPPVQVPLPGGNTGLVYRGINLFYEGPSPLPMICQGELVWRFFFSSTTHMGGYIYCNLPEWKLLRNVIPTINHIAFQNVALTAQIEGTELKFGLATDFQLATGPSDCSQATDPQCLRMSLEVLIGIQQTPPSISIEVDFDALGVWVTPLKLRNFAVVDPRFGIALDLFPPVPPVGPVVILRAISWSVTIYYKPNDNDAWPAALTAPMSQGAWPPNLVPLAQKGGILRMCKSQFLLEKWHANLPDTLLHLAGLPRFALRLHIPYLSLADVMKMFVDFYLSVAEFASGQKLPAAPPAVTELMSVVNDLVQLEMSVFAELSLVDGPVPEWGMTGRCDTHPSAPPSSRAQSALATRPEPPSSLFVVRARVRVRCRWRVHPAWAVLQRDGERCQLLWLHLRL